MKYAFLLLAVFSEVIAVLSLKPSQGFTKLWPTIIAMVGFVAAFYFLSHAIRQMSVGVAYSIWAGFGIISLALMGLVMKKFEMDIPALIGMMLIIAGVIIINVFSSASPIRGTIY